MSAFRATPQGRTEPMSVEITQADREAAAAWYAATGNEDAAYRSLHPVTPEGGALVQAFAKHRSTSTEEVERLTGALKLAHATLTYLFECSDDPHASEVARKAANAADTALTGASNHVG